MPAWDGFAAGRSAASGGPGAATIAEPAGTGKSPGRFLPGFGRGLRGLAVSLLVALAATLPPATAEAQTSRTLVSNTGQTVSLQVWTGTQTGSNQKNAQEFTTGDHSLGYILESVRLRLDDFEDSSETAGEPPDTVTVSICPDDGSGNPGMPCTQLTSPNTLMSWDGTGNLNTFTAPPGTTLDSGTTYLVLVEVSGGLLSWDSTSSHQEDAGAASGWSIDDEYRFKVDDGNWRASTAFSDRLFIAINGRESPPPPPDAPGLQAAPGDTRVRINWSEPASDGGSRITGYEFRYAAGSSVPSSTPWTRVRTPEFRTALFQNLDNGTRYSFEVRARNAGGPGAAATTSRTPRALTCKAPALWDRHEIWSSTLTVGYHGGSTATAVEQAGFGAGRSKRYSYGTLSSPTFSLGTNSYEVEDLYTTVPDDGERRRAFLSFSGGRLPTNVEGPLRLHICDREKDPEVVPGASHYRWEPSDRFSHFNDFSLYPTLRVSLSVPMGPATGAPTISGSRQVGQTLTVSTAGISDPNGLTNPGWRYRWFRINAIGATGGTDEIEGETSSSYTLTEADIGKAVYVEVKFVDDFGREEKRNSAPFAQNQAVVPTHCNPSDPAEIWCATMTVGAGMDTNYGTATGYDARYTLDITGDLETGPVGTADRLTPRRFTYNGTEFKVSRLAYNERRQLHWRARRPDGVAGQIGSGRYLLKLKKGASETSLLYDDPTTGGKYWTDHGVSWSAGDTVEAKLVKVDDNSPATGAPAVTGTARVGEELTADTSAIADANGKPADSALNYQWYRVETNPTRETAIEGATAKTYRLGPLDWQKQVKVRVAFTDDDRYEEAVTSALFPASGTVGARQGTAAHSHCDPGDVNEVWCTVMTVGSFSVHRGYYQSSYGSVVSGDIIWPPTLTEVRQLSVSTSGGQALTLTIFGDRGDNNFALEIGTGPDRKTFVVANQSGASGFGTWFNWSNHGLSWSAGDTVPVRLVRLRRLSEGPRLEEPSGTEGWLRVRWNREPGTHPVAAYRVRWKKTTRANGNYFAQVAASARSHLVDNLEAGADYDVSVCEVSRLKSGTAASDTIGNCSPWSRIRMRGSGTLANNIRVALEFPDGGESVTLGSSENTVTWRYRVTGLANTSRQLFRSRNLWVATARTYLRFQNESQYVQNPEGAGSSVLRYHDYFRQPIYLSQLTIDGVGTGWFEQETDVASSLRSTTGKGPLTLALAKANASPDILSPGGDRRGQPRELCVQVNAGEACTGGQIEIAPPVVEETPTLAGAGSDATWTEGDNVDVTVTFSEAVEVDVTGGTPTIGVGLGGQPANAREAAYTSGSGTTELVFRYTLVQEDGSHSYMSVAPNSLATGGGTIRSVATQADAVLEHNGALTQGTSARGTGAEASFVDPPENHDGESGFKLRVRFSGVPSGLSPKRDAASVLEVVGGTVTAATAETKDPGSPWSVTVEPDGNAEVTVRIPVRDCTEPGAVCIGGQPLAEAAEAVVPGPQAAGCPAPGLTGGAVLAWTGRIGIAKWPGNEFYGFGNGVRGTLDDRDFTLGSNDYLVDHVTQRGGGTGPLLFSLESGLSADEKRTLTLHVCEDGKELRLSEASGPSRWQTYQWNRAGLDWSSHAERTLHLVQDATPPTLTSATVAGTSLALAFSETLAPASGLGAGAFTVTADASPVTVSSVQVDAGTVTLALASPVSAGAAVTVSYAQPAGANDRLRDRFDNPVANITGRTVDSGTVAGGTLPAVSIAAGSTPVTEGTAAAFTLTRTGATDGALTVTVAVSETGAAVSGTAPAEVTFAAESSTASLSVATEDDEVVESASTVMASVTSEAGYTVDDASGSAEVAVEDDDAAPAVTTASPIEVAENATAVATLAATDDDTPVEELAWSIPEGEAGGADAAAFEVTAEGVLTFKAAKDFETPDDADTDGDYEVTVRVTDGANPVDAPLVVRLSDADEAAPVLSGASVDGATLVLTFGEALDEASAPAAAAFAVTVGTDARAVEALALAGDTVTLTLASAVTAGEVVTVSYTAPADPDPGLRDAAGNRVAGFADADVTNATAAVLPAVSIAPASSPVTEGTAAAFTLTRTGPAAAALTVSVSVSEAGSMLDGTPPSSATFAAGSSQTRLAVATVNDATHEADARVTASVVAGAGYTVDGASAGVDVFDDDTGAPGQQEAVETLWSTVMLWKNVGYGWYGGYAEGRKPPPRRQRGPQGRTRR